METVVKLTEKRRIINDDVTKEEAHKIAKNLLCKWRMNDGFKAPEDPHDAYVAVISTDVYCTQGSELLYEFTAEISRSENLEYMASRFIQAVEQELAKYSEFKYFSSVLRST